jgi:hypothetical protein
VRDFDFCSLVNSIMYTAALRDDDADDSDVEDDTNPGESTEHQLVNKLKEMEQPRMQKERHPTGRIVGMVKRNWRA